MGFAVASLGCNGSNLRKPSSVEERMIEIVRSFAMALGKVGGLGYPANSSRPKTT